MQHLARIVLLVSALALVGCGGGGSPGSAPDFQSKTLSLKDSMGASVSILPALGDPAGKIEVAVKFKEGVGVAFARLYIVDEFGSVVNGSNGTLMGLRGTTGEFVGEDIIGPNPGVAARSFNVEVRGFNAVGDAIEHNSRVGTAIQAAP
jgi:hypothetical protein